MSHQHLLGELQRRHSLFAGDAGEILQELVHGIAGLQVIEQGADRDASANEDRRAAQNVGIRVDYWTKAQSWRASFSDYCGDIPLRRLITKFSGPDRRDNRR
jgi:hypothetical protein